MSLRKILEFVSLAGVLYLAWITADALFGPRRLGSRVPMHFDAAGNADGWGSPWALAVLPLVAIGIYALMTVVARRPSAFNFPVRVTPRTRPRLEALAVEMIAWLKAEVVCLFAWIQTVTLETVRHGGGRLSPLVVPCVLVAVFATIVGYVVAMRRAVRA
jgi:Domain of unknown function (DUF1648)